MANLDFKFKIYNTKHIFPSFFFFFLKKKKKNLKGITKTTHHEMHECYAVQILKAKREQTNKRRMVTKNIEMKHIDHESQ